MSRSIEATCCCGVIVPCCEDVVLPRTLYITVTNSGTPIFYDCTCAVGSVMEVTYNRETGMWEGEGDWGEGSCDGLTYAAAVYCDEAYTPPKWVVGVAIFGCNDPFGHAGAGGVAVLSQCDPFYFECGMSLLPTDCCEAPAGPVTITFEVSGVA